MRLRVPLPLPPTECNNLLILQITHSTCAQGVGISCVLENLRGRNGFLLQRRLISVKSKKKKKRWGWNELREVKGAKPNSWTMHAFLQFASPLPKKEKKKKVFKHGGIYYVPGTILTLCMHHKI